MPESTGLTAAILRETEAASRFAALLREEREVLQNGEIDALPQLVERKAEVVAELSAHGSERNSLLAASNYAVDRAGVEAWQQRHPQDETVKAAWAKLKALVTEARELNRVNGKLIHLRMQHNAQALGALLATNQRSGLYGPDGQPAQFSGNRIIDAA